MVSYIVPVYNAEKYLNQCIESILEILNPEDEVILIDDGSQDNSGKICDAYAMKSTQVIVKHVPNGGVSRARNLGVQMAKGEFIRFIDSDDTIVSAAVSTTCDWLVMDADVVSDNGEKIRSVHLNNAFISDARSVVNDMNVKSKMCLLHYLWNHLYRASIIKEYQLWFDESVTLGEDFLFNCDYLLHCNSIEYIPVSCYQYFVRRTNDNNLTKKFHPDELKRRRCIDEAFIKLFEKFNCRKQNADKIAEMIGGITIGSLEAIAVKNGKLPFKQVKNYLNGFYDSEYYGYVISYINANAQPGKSEKIEFALIKRKSCFVFYFYILLRTYFRKGFN